MEVLKDRWKIKPRQTALVIVDLQRAWSDESAPKNIPEMRQIIPGINQLADICRRLRIPVIFVREAFRPDLSDMGLMKELRPPDMNSEWEPIEGRKGADFDPRLKITREDYIVTKIRYSAFISGSSSLEPLLRGLGCDSLMVCGGATEVCAQFTAADAMMLGFRVFFIRDLTARITEDKTVYEGILFFINRQFAKVMTLKEIKRELE